MILHTQKLLHGNNLTHRHFLHRFYTQKVLDTDAFKYIFFTEEPLHKAAFTNRRFYTERPLHRPAFTHTHSYFFTDQPLHRAVFTHSFFPTSVCGVLMGSCFWLCTPGRRPSRPSPSVTFRLTHNSLTQLTHPQLSHTQLSHAQLTHTHKPKPSHLLSHAALSHTTFSQHSHTTLMHNPLTHNSSHTTLSHTTYSHTTTLSVTCAVTSYGGRGTWWRAPRSFVWQAWHLACVALMALGWLWWRAWSRLVRRNAAVFCVASVALGAIHGDLVWPAWHLVRSTFTTCVAGVAL